MTWVSVLSHPTRWQAFQGSAGKDEPALRFKGRKSCAYCGRLSSLAERRYGGSLLEMKKNGFQDHLIRFTDEIKSDKFGVDLRDRFVVAWTLFSRIPLPQKWWPAKMPSGNRTLSLAPLAGGILGLLTGLVIGISDLLGIGAPGSLWIGVFFYAAVGWSLPSGWVGRPVGRRWFRQREGRTSFRHEGQQDRGLWCDRLDTCLRPVDFNAWVR